MHTGDENPLIHCGKTAKDALFVMTDKGLGAASVIDDEGKFVGLITDGIIRRALAKDYKFLDEAVENIMFKEPLTIAPQQMAAAALSVMEKHKPRPVTVLPVIDEKRRAGRHRAFDGSLASGSGLIWNLQQKQLTVPKGAAHHL